MERLSYLCLMHRYLYARNCLLCVVSGARLLYNISLCFLICNKIISYDTFSIIIPRCSIVPNFILLSLFCFKPTKNCKEKKRIIMIYNKICVLFSILKTTIPLKIRAQGGGINLCCIINAR